MLFRRRSEGDALWLSRLDEWFRERERRLAGWLGRKAGRVSPQRLRWYAVVLLLGMAVLNLSLTLFSVRGRMLGKAVPPVGWSVPLRLPAAERRVTDADMREVLEAIRRDSAESQVLDSLLRARPGLGDSLKMLEERK